MSPWGISRRFLQRLRGAEQWIDRTVTDGLAKAFPSPLDRVEIKAALLSECDAKARALPGGRIVAPNEYSVTLAETEYVDDPAHLRELTKALEEHIKAERYTLAGPVALILRPDPDQLVGIAMVRSAVLARGDIGAPDSSDRLLIGARRIGLPEGDFSIGRDDAMDLRLDDVAVSRHHCDIRNQFGTLSIHDHSSTNGTMVNGLRVTKAELNDGDVIAIGSTEMVIEREAQ